MLTTSRRPTRSCYKHNLESRRHKVHLLALNRWSIGVFTKSMHTKWSLEIDKIAVARSRCTARTPFSESQKHPITSNEIHSAQLTDTNRNQNQKAYNKHPMHPTTHTSHPLSFPSATPPHPRALSFSTPPVPTHNRKVQRRSRCTCRSNKTSHSPPSPSSL